MASKRRLRRKQRQIECGNKQRHETQHDAVRHKIALEQGQGAYALRTYKCRFCGYWHVGHIPRGHGR